MKKLIAVLLGITSLVTVTTLLFRDPTAVVFADSTADTLPGTGSTNNGAGGNLWLNPSRITLADGSFASAAVTTARLRATNFGFSVPSDATINGVVLEVNNKWVTASVKDLQVLLLKATTEVGTNHASTTAWSSTASTFTYGSPTDLWGTTLTPTDVNDSGFGASVSAQTASSGGSAQIDYMRITVYYTVASGDVQSNTVIFE